MFNIHKQIVTKNTTAIAFMKKANEMPKSETATFLVNFAINHNIFPILIYFQSFSSLTVDVVSCEPKKTLTALEENQFQLLIN